MASNGISTLSSKELKQTTKLAMAEAKRQGKVVALDGTWTGNANVSQPWARTLNVLDIDLLPTVYSGNVIVDNPNGPGGTLTQGRPWGEDAVIVLVTPATDPEEAVAPSTFITLQFWYDAADTDTLIPSATDEGQITQWTDKSVLAHNANPNGGTSKPNYENTVPLAGNGYVEFDGNDNLTINPFTDLASQPGFTVFFVSQLADTTGVQYIGSTNDNDLRLFSDGTSMTVGMNGATGTVANVATTSWTLHSVTFDGTGEDNESRLVYRVNKSAQTLSFTGTVGTLTSPVNNVFIMGNDITKTMGMEGYIAEAVLFNKTLTSAEIQNVENYLSNKWGL